MEPDRVPETLALEPARRSEAKTRGVSASVWERLGQAQQLEGPTLGRLAPLSLGEIGDAPKLAGLPKPPGTAPRNTPGG